VVRDRDGRTCIFDNRSITFSLSKFDIRQLTEARGERPERKRGCNVVEMEMEMVIMTSKLSCINNGGEHVPLVVAVVFASVGGASASAGCY